MANVSLGYEITDLELVEKLLQTDKEKVFVAVQVAPAVRVTIGEKLGLKRGEDALGKLSTALRALGADAVLDTAIAQDALTLKMLRLLKEKKEKRETPLVLGGGDCKLSPLEISARLVKKYYGAQAAGRLVRVVTVACCEKAKTTGGADVVLTADELVTLLQSANMNVRLLEKSAIDTPFGVASGSAYICASAAGKTEAIARCLLADKTRATRQKLAYSGLYGKGAVREGIFDADGKRWQFAVVACSTEAERIRAEIERGECPYDLVEFTCGGCIAHGLADCAEKEMTLRLRGLGLRYLDRSRAARSADCSAYAAPFLKSWERMERSGEAYIEYPPVTEEELAPLFVVEEAAVTEA